MKVLADANRAPHRWKKFGTMLACAGTNAATDNLAEGLLAEGVRVVRLGQPAKVIFLNYSTFNYLVFWVLRSLTRGSIMFVAVNGLRCL